MSFFPQLRSPSVQRLVLIALLAILLAGLLYFSFLGTYNRSYADDWCYAADFTELGLSQTLAGYTTNTTYSASRFSLTLFSGLFFPLGIVGYQALTFLLLAFLAWGLFRLLHILPSVEPASRSSLSIAFIALLVSFFAIYIAPLRYQSFYWLSGALPYTFPLIFTIWILVLINESPRHASRPAYLLPLLGALAFFGAAFSEAGAAFLVTAILITWLLFRFIPRANLSSASIKLPVLWSLAWALFAGLILMLSPAAWERASRYGELAGLFEFMSLTLRFSWDFVRLSILDLPLPHLALVAGAAFLAFLSPGAKPQSSPWRVLAIIALISFTLIAASYAPSALIEKNPPHPRTRVLARTTMLLGLFAISYLFAAWLAHRKPFIARSQSLSILIGLLLLLYVARALFFSLELNPIYFSRAEIWDQRHAILLESAEQGAELVEVQAIDGAPIGGLRDFRQASRHWINVCAARVYGLDAISGLP